MRNRAIVFAALMFVVPLIAGAVLPPDIIFSVGTQLWQVVVGVGALIVGSVTAVFPFMRSLSARLLRARVVMLSTGIAVMLLGLAYLLYISTETSPSSIAPIEHVASSTTGYEFHANRFVFLGTRTNGDRVLINMDLNRKELTEGGFVHYYMGGITMGTTSLTFETERNAVTREVLPDLFFSSFMRDLPPDHSAREAYNLVFSLGGHEIKIITEMITSDFLIKNEPEYTAYIGVGSAHGSIDGESIDFHAMTERVYSNDYRPAVFFDPEDKLPTETVQLVLWDEEGNFYLADRSKVGVYSPAYASHFWGLLKSASGTIERVFANDAIALNKKGDTSFHAEFVGNVASSTADLRLIRSFDGVSEEGYVEGAVVHGGSTRSAAGYGYHHFYGPR